MYNNIKLNTFTAQQHSHSNTLKTTTHKSQSTTQQCTQPTATYVYNNRNATIKHNNVVRYVSAGEPVTAKPGTTKHC